MNIGIICKYPIPYGMAATTRIFSYSKGLLECGDKVDVWSIAPNNFNANNNNEGVFNGISYFYSFRSKRFSNKLFHAYEMIYSLFILGVKLHKRDKIRRYDVFIISSDSLICLLYMRVLNILFKRKLIFIFDEWDYIFTNNLFENNQNDFLEFIRQLLKDQPYVALAYMTGVLPIKKYSSGSALNMFDEYTFLKDRIYDEYFGFTNEEVLALCEKNDEIKFSDLESWYNGYLTTKGKKIYNPRSVIKALENGYCESYWTNTGAMDEVTDYLKYNTLEIREDVIEMVSGEEVDIFIDEEFRAGQREPRTKEEIYSAMIILGFLSYHDGYLRIPNRELMKEFEKALKDDLLEKYQEL